MFMGTSTSTSKWFGKKMFRKFEKWASAYYMQTSGLSREVVILCRDSGITIMVLWHKLRCGSVAPIATVTFFAIHLPMTLLSLKLEAFSNDWHSSYSVVVRLFLLQWVCRLISFMVLPSSLLLSVAHLYVADKSGVSIQLLWLSLDRSMF